VAFGACATLESLVRIELNDPDKEVDLSEMRLFMCGGGDCDDGWWNSDACSYLEDNGTPDETCWPYQDENKPCSNSCSNWQLRTVKITDFGHISGIEACKTYVAIAPILVAMDVYDDFFSYESGIYEHVWGNYISGHAICIVGYNTNSPTPYWICKNSWGSEEWGESGFFKIKMGECRIETRATYWMSEHILPSPPDEEPYDLSAHSTSWYDVILNWQDNSNNESGFEIQRKKAGETFSTLGETKDNCQSFHDYWFNGDYTYYYRVRAFNLGGNSLFTDTINFTIESTPIYAPSYLNGRFKYGSGAVELTWYDNSNNEQGFAIERKSEYEPWWKEIDRVGPNFTSYDDSDVWPDTFYYYRVRAYNPSGYSSYSNIKRVYVPQY